MDDELEYVKKSGYRTNIIKSLDCFPKIPSELAKDTGIATNHVSHTLKELSEIDLVVCINPEVARGRMYRLTEKGKTMAKKI
jgi:DNA-binding HxlR family transcriptional regulator